MDGLLLQQHRAIHLVSLKCTIFMGGGGGGLCHFALNSQLLGDLTQSTEQ